MPAPSFRTTLLLFTRFPVPGQVKTRLIPALGPDGAAALHDRLVHHTLRAVRHWILGGPQRCGLICLDNATDAEAQRWIPNMPYEVQIQGDLGDRLRHAVSSAFAKGSDQVIIIGSDCPRASAADFSAAQAALARVDLVLGPAADGGYWLIGLKSPHLLLFDQIPWGTPHVLTTTVARATSNHLTIKLLSTLPDVDLPEDLPDALAVLASKY